MVSELYNILRFLIKSELRTCLKLNLKTQSLDFIKDNFKMVKKNLFSSQCCLMFSKHYYCKDKYLWCEVHLVLR